MKIEIGSAPGVDAGEPEVPTAAEVAGRDQVTGLLRRVELDAEEVRTALEPPLARIIEAITEALERTPPELAADVFDRGIALVGGGVRSCAGSTNGFTPSRASPSAWSSPRSRASPSVRGEASRSST